MLRFVWLFLLASLAFCEEHRLTLRQAVELAAKQNPDVALARIDEEKARAGIRVARDPFLPRLVAGSGLAYSSGFPLSVEGSAPTIFQANARQYIFNRPQSFQIAQAKEDARGAGYAVASKRDEVVYRAAALYLDAERASRVGELARKSITDQQQVLASVQAQVREGRALPLAEKQAALAVARSRQLAENLTEDAAAAQSQLAILLGFAAEDRVLTVEQERAAPALPESEEQAVQAALRSNAELRQIQSQMASKQLEIRGERAQRLPRIDLVAQYGMLAKFNNYAEFFQKYQRNNGEIGMSFQVPLFSPAVKAMTAQSDAELARLKLELTNARNRIAADLQQAYRDERKSASAAEVARLDLDVARAQIDVDLALMQEGRLTMREMEQARLAESDKWIAFYDAQYTLEKARWNVLRMTGGLEAAIAGAP